MAYVLDRLLRAREFESLGRLIGSVPPQVRSRTNYHEALPEVCARLAAAFEKLAAAWVVRA